METTKRGRGRPRGDTHDWVVLGLTVSPEIARRLAEVPAGQKGRTVDTALRVLFAMSDEELAQWIT